MTTRSPRPAQRTPTPLALYSGRNPVHKFLSQGGATLSPGTIIYNPEVQEVLLEGLLSQAGDECRLRHRLIRSNLVPTPTTGRRRPAARQGRFPHRLLDGTFERVGTYADALQSCEDNATEGSGSGWDPGSHSRSSRQSAVEPPRRIGADLLGDRAVLYGLAGQLAPGANDPARGRCVGALLSTLLAVLLSLRASSRAPASAAPAPSTPFCALPGSVVWTAQGASVVPGVDASAAPDLSWLSLPAGFCAHYFAASSAVVRPASVCAEVILPSTLKPRPPGEISRPVTRHSRSAAERRRPRRRCRFDDHVPRESAVDAGSPLRQWCALLPGRRDHSEPCVQTGRPAAPPLPSRSSRRSAPQDTIIGPRRSISDETGRSASPMAARRTTFASPGGSTRSAIFALGDGGVTNLVAQGFAADRAPLQAATTSTSIRRTGSTIRCFTTGARSWCRFGTATTGSYLLRREDPLRGDDHEGHPGRPRLRCSPGRSGFGSSSAAALRTS